MNHKTAIPIGKFLIRFSLAHTATYLVVGILFMLISGYFDYFAENDLLSQVMRPADSIYVQIAPLVQLLRGALLGLALYPFAETILHSRHGWLKLAGLLWVLTGVGAVITGPGSIEGFLYTYLGFGNPLIGFPEITCQMLLFAWLFTRWMNRPGKKAQEASS
ncbi:MAG: hypothetical protein JW750_07085 [Anaerolineaceae bacterium]|nr:hypothetical protein [Anaerolineaceae bacterium]